MNRLSRQLAGEDGGIRVMREVSDIVRGTATKSLAASLKSEDEVIAAVLAGAEDITIPLDLILALGDHELSQQAIDDFASAMAQDQPWGSKLTLEYTSKCNFGYIPIHRYLPTL